MGQGLFIVLEGVDGAGTTTHARALAKALKDEETPVLLTAEPSQGPVGGLLRQVLMRRMMVGDERGGFRPPAWNTMALMFAADRLDHLEHEIVPMLSRGIHVICDRYYHSSVAYQSVTGGRAEAIPWIRELNRFARAPDLTIVLDVPAPVAAARRRARGGGEIYDVEALQRSLCAFYAELEQHFPGERVVHIDATGSIADVGEQVRAHVAQAGVSHR